MYNSSSLPSYMYYNNGFFFVTIPSQYGINIEADFTLLLANKDNDFIFATSENDRYLKTRVDENAYEIDCLKNNTNIKWEDLVNLNINLINVFLVN